MKIFLANQTLPHKPRIIALGNFDGVHLGHQVILKNACNLATEINGVASVFLFDPHPMTLLQPEKEHKLLTSFDIRAEIFEGLGVDELILYPFNREMQMMSPWDFFTGILINRLKAQGFSVGFDYTFGYRHEGNSKTIEEFCRKKGIKISINEEVLWQGQPVSSTWIKKSIFSGDLQSANALMGREYSVFIKSLSRSDEGYLLEFSKAAILPQTGTFKTDIQKEAEAVRASGILKVDRNSYIFYTENEVDIKGSYRLFFT